MDIRANLTRLIAAESLSAAATEELFTAIMDGALTPAQIGAVLVALAAKGESIEELVGAARAMRAHALPLQVSAKDVVDTCGTGGDAQDTFNVSTAAALIAAAAGATVVKHGNRAMSGKVGAADVLEALGVRIDLPPEGVQRCVEEIGLGFAFAQRFHPAMRHAAGPRRELGVRTMFNLLGPLSNPAGARRQVIGVFHRRWLEPVAAAAKELGSVHVMVVHSDDGLDELSLSGATQIAELKGGEVGRWTLHPSDVGLGTCALNDIRIDNLAMAQRALLRVLDGESGALHDIAVLNAGAAIYVSGHSDDLNEGVAAAQSAIRTGAARRKLDDLIEVSNR